MTLTPAVKIASSYAVGLLALFLSTSACSQEKKTHPRPTEQQVAEFIKNNPTLSSGFQTPVQKATVRVVKPIRGGLLLSYETANVKGTSVVGPTETVLASRLATWGNKAGKRAVEMHYYDNNHDYHHNVRASLGR